MKKFFAEFKKFITRGNVIDMAVGVIVGSAFTAIVNALSNNILKPLINWILALIFGANSLEEIYTFLKPAYAEDGTLDLVNSIYIDWGAFINAVINFLIIAFVLFNIVRLMNRVKEGRNKLLDQAGDDRISRADKRAMKAQGISYKNTAAVAEYYAKKAEAEQKAKDEAAAKAAAERLANPTVEDLLKDIRALLQQDK